MNDAVQYFNNVVNESIPFTVKDVLKAINAGEQPPSASRAGSSSTSSSDGWTARKID
jgi:hypothetical protein